MYSPIAKARLSTPESPADKIRRVTRSRTIAPSRRREALRLETLRNEVAVLALAAYYNPKPPPDRRPLWKRSLKAGRQLEGAK